MSRTIVESAFATERRRGQKESQGTLQNLDQLPDLRPKQENVG